MLDLPGLIKLADEEVGQITVRAVLDASFRRRGVEGDGARLMPGAWAVVEVARFALDRTITYEVLTLRLAIATDVLR